MGTPTEQDLSVSEGESTPENPCWLEVWVDQPKRSGCYTYRVPDHLTLAPGDILAVPFGSQTMNAIALRFLHQLPPDLLPTRIRPVTEVVSAGILPPTFWPLLQQVSSYYLTPLAQVLRTVLPSGLLSRSQKRIRLCSAPLVTTGLSDAAQQILSLLQQKKGDLSWTYLKRQIPQVGSGLNELIRPGWVESYWRENSGPQPKHQQAVILCDDSCDDLSPQQRDLLLTLKRAGGDLLLTELLERGGATRSTVQALARKGRVQISARQILRTLQGPAIPADQPKQLTPAQHQAVTAVKDHLDRAQSFLLHGVTGSGKTEVYLQVIAEVLERGRSALVLVPEIGLTPQLTDRFRARFGSKVLVYHSGLSTGERYDTWRAMLSDQPQVVVGTRSAIFAPLPQLGLIILDEEHDDSYKQDQPQPCYHARTVAYWRSLLCACPLILGSATPAVETYAASLQHRIQILSLPERIPRIAQAEPPVLPPITLVDLRLELEKGNRSPFSQYLQEALDRILERGEQGILFVPRRGYSTFVLCRSCGEALSCDHCDVSLTFHQTGQDLRCHYCGDRQPHPEFCPSCGSPYLKHFGSGTQRIEDLMTQRWPQLRILRFDSDTTSRKGAHRQILDRFNQGEADVLVGTQMLTKGLDVPQVTLVGVLAADGILNQADFRASERAFQLLTQVAGRAGRGERGGQVIIQTYLPEHPTLQSIQAYHYEQFITQELEHRLEGGYPPYRPLILIRLSSPDPIRLQQGCDQIRQQLEGISAEILGPCPAQVERVGGRHRWQILLKPLPDEAWDRQALAKRLLALQAPPEVRVSLDVDPLRIL